MDAHADADQQGREPGAVRGSGGVGWGWLAPWLIFAGALVVRLVYLAQAAHADPLFGHVEAVADSRFYDASARAVAAGRLWPSSPFFLAPLYFYVMATLYALVGPDVLAVQLLQAVLGAATCGLVQRIGARVFSARVGTLAGAALALYGLHVYYTGVILPTVLVTFLNVAFLWLLVDVGSQAGLGRLLVAGGVLGLAVAAKPNAILMLPPAALALWLGEPDGALRRRLGRTATLALGTLLVTAPFLAQGRATGGEFVFITTTAGRNLLKGNGPGANGTHIPLPEDLNPTGLLHYQTSGVPGPVAVAEDAGLRLAARRYMLEHPGRTAALLVKKTLLFWNAVELSIRDQYYFARRYAGVLRLPLLSFGVMAPLALVGLLTAWRGRPRAWLLYGAIAAQLASFVPLFILGRYRMVAVTCLLPFAAHAVVTGAEALRERRWRALAAGGVAWGLAAALVHLPFKEFPPDRGFAEQWQSVGDHALVSGDAQAAARAYRAALVSRWLEGDETSKPLEVRVQLARAELRNGDPERAQREVETVRRTLTGPPTRWPRRLRASLAAFEREQRRASER